MGSPHIMREGEAKKRFGVGQPESLETERVTDRAVLSIGILRLPAVFVSNFSKGA